jgi:hypothetical protein
MRSTGHRESVGSMSEFSDANGYKDLIECCHLVLDRCHDVDQKIVCFGSHDARRLAIAGVQKHVAGLFFSLVALTRGRSRAEVSALFAGFGPSAEEGRAYTHDFWRFGLTSIIHFRIDSMFQMILKARGEYKSKSAFTSMLRQILDVCQLTIERASRASFWRRHIYETHSTIMECIVGQP